MRERGFLAAWRFYREHFVAVFTLSLVFYATLIVLAAASVAGAGWFALIAVVYLMLASIFWLQAPLARLMDDVREDAETKQAPAARPASQSRPLSVPEGAASSRARRGLTATGRLFGSTDPRP